MNFEYEVIDSFDDAGNKISQILSHNAVFVDCGYLNKDFYEIIYNLAIVLQQHNYGLFVLLRPRLNQLLVYMRDELKICDFVPEIDIVFKNQMELY